MKMHAWNDEYKNRYKKHKTHEVRWKRENKKRKENEQKSREKKIKRNDRRSRQAGILHACGYSKRIRYTL